MTCRQFGPLSGERLPMTIGSLRSCLESFRATHFRKRWRWRKIPN